jgi:hypothetical protein
VPPAALERVRRKLAEFNAHQVIDSSQVRFAELRALIGTALPQAPPLATVLASISLRII